MQDYIRAKILVLIFTFDVHSSCLSDTKISTISLRTCIVYPTPRFLPSVFPAKAEHPRISAIYTCPCLTRVHDLHSCSISSLLMAPPSGRCCFFKPKKKPIFILSSSLALYPPGPYGPQPLTLPLSDLFYLAPHCP